MRRDTLLGVGFLLASVGELQWATVFYKASDLSHALMLFVAGAALLLVAGGLFFTETRGWTLFTGLLFAALAHAAYFVTTTTFATILVVAAGLAFVGLAIASWGTRSAKFEPMYVRLGLGLAFVAGALWTYADITDSPGPNNFVVGDVFASIGYAMSAAFAGQPEP